MEQGNSYDDLFSEGENKPNSPLWGSKNYERISGEVTPKERIEASRKDKQNEAEMETER